MSWGRTPKKSELRTRREQQLASLYDEYYDRIARYALVRIGSRDDAEDIAGDVFLKALVSLDSYEERGLPMQAWLFKIAHNQVVDYLRNKSRSTTLPDEAESLAVSEEGDPEELAELSVDLQKTLAAMQQLSPDQREVLGLRFLAGLPSKEVARIVNKSDGAVREMQRSAIEKLRVILGVKRKQV